MNYQGVIIEESLGDKSVIQRVNVIKTKVEKVTPEHKTPWLIQWTLCTVEVQEEASDQIADVLSKSFDTKHHNWYADFKNNKFHYIVFTNRVFKVDLQNPVLYQAAKQYGISIGIPEYQVDFTPEDIVWERQK